MHGQLYNMFHRAAFDSSACLACWKALARRWFPLGPRSVGAQSAREPQFQPPRFRCLSKEC
eukprot:9292816-Heterocapsa_arctica.AAC.1